MASDSLFVVRLNNGQLAGTSVADIRGMLDQARASRSKARVVFHVGDGLIDDAEGQRVAERLAPAYEEAGACPLFVHWGTRARDDLAARVVQIAAERLYRALTRVLVKHLSARLSAPPTADTREFPTIDDGSVEIELARLDADGEPFGELETDLDAGARVVAAEERHLVAALSSDPDVGRASSDVVAALLEGAAFDDRRTTRSPLAFFSPDVVNELGRDVGRWNFGSPGIPPRIVDGTVEIMRRSVGRWAAGRGHGLYPTIVEEVLRECLAGALEPHEARRRRIVQPVRRRPRAR